jgi:hypothetical protein
MRGVLLKPYRKSFIFMYVLIILAFSLVGWARYSQGAMTGVTNHALNKTATAKSVEKDNTASWAPKFAVDGDMKTRWSSYFADNQWITVDLGESKYTGGVNIYWENPAKNFRVQRSYNGTNWTTQKTITGNTEKINTLLWNLKTARYIRIQCDVRSNDHGFSIYELEVFPPKHDMEIGVKWDANTTPETCNDLAPEDCFLRWDKLNFYLRVHGGEVDYNHPIHVLSQSYVNGASTPTNTKFNVEFDKFEKTPIEIIVRSAAVVGGEEIESVDSDPGAHTVDLSRPTKLEALRIGETDEGKVIFEWFLHDDPRVGSYMISMSDTAGTGYKEILRRTHEGEKNNPGGMGNAYIDRDQIFTEPGQTKHFTIVSITSDKFGAVHSRWAPDSAYTWTGTLVPKKVAPVQGFSITN